jgi:hypothetical protein
VSEPQEDSFWTTPGARKTLQFKNELLVDEEVDLEDVTSSFLSPVAPFKSSAPRRAHTDSPFQEEAGPTEDTIPEDSSTLEDTFDRTCGAYDSNLESAEDVDDPTTNVKSQPIQPLLRPVPSSTREPSTPTINREQGALPSTAENAGHTHSAKKIRVTNDVERIVVRDNQNCKR